MCPVRAVSIFKTLMGSRLACRKGSDGGAEWTKGLLAFAELQFRKLRFSQAKYESVFLAVEIEGDVIMTQFSPKLLMSHLSDLQINVHKKKQNI